MKGFLFHKGGLKCIVSKVYTPLATGDAQAVGQSHLVEMSCVVPAGQGEASVGDDVKRFADLFKPYVRMDKMHALSDMPV